ncbi:hypothetical protein HGA91_01755 [candidate division WWE3 bacterium]|nr:hypothetical protein [candidate division WWE3 bacterium]
MDSASSIYKIIQQYDNFVLPLHVSPDGDSVASTLAMREALLSLGKRVRVTCDDKLGIEADIDFILSPDSIIQKETPLPLDIPSVYIFMDGSELYRFTQTSIDLNHPHIQRVINIDHHPKGDIADFIDKSGKGAWVNQDGLTANTQVLLNLFKSWDITITDRIAKLLMYGIYSDTEGLQNSDLQTQTFTDLATLTELGADWHEFVVNVTWNVSLDTMMLLKEYLSRLNLDEEYGFAWVVLPYWILAQYDESNIDFDYIKHRCLRVIKGIRFAADIKEKEDGRITVSLRARTPDIDLGELAKKISAKGGGHPGAAGAIIEGMTLVEAEDHIVDASREYLSRKGFVKNPQPKYLV